MADTHGIGMPLPPQGTVKVTGKAHGALNTIVMPADGSQWYFRQFVDPEELYQFVQMYNLTMTGELPNDSANDHGA